MGLGQAKELASQYACVSFCPSNVFLASLVVFLGSQRISEAALRLAFALDTLKRGKARYKCNLGKFCQIRGNSAKLDPCPKECFWRVRFFSAPLRFALKTPGKP